MLAKIPSVRDARVENDRATNCRTDSREPLQPVAVVAKKRRRAFLSNSRCSGSNLVLKTLVSGRRRDLISKFALFMHFPKPRPGWGPGFRHQWWHDGCPISRAFCEMWAILRTRLWHVVAGGPCIAFKEHPG